jgi:hypothetical protein
LQSSYFTQYPAIYRCIFWRKELASSFEPDRQAAYCARVDMWKFPSMSTISRIAAATLCTLLLSPVTADAATVSKRSGGVLINKGSGFVTLGADAELAPGQQVMVQQGGSASIVYASNCVVRVGSGVWFVQAVPPCANGATEIDFTGRMNQETPPTEPPGVTPFVVGGVIIAGGVAAAIVLTQNKDKAASP